LILSTVPSSPTLSLPQITIEANRSEVNYWRDLWRYRELLVFLAWRDIKIRYAQATLGIAWALIQPAVQTLLLTFVFGRLAKMPSGEVPYLMLVLTGLLPWQLFSSAFSNSGSSLLGNAHLISKVFFPRLIIPMAGLGVAFCDFSVVCVITIPISLFYGIYPSWQLLFLPLCIVATLVIALGAGLWITALTVKYRDFRFISPFILQFGVFITPVGFRTDLLSNWAFLLSFNPLTGVVEAFRWSLLGGQTEVNLAGLAISLAMAVLLLITGLIYFRKTERYFADII
jgi:lipopolysaccharide transport system permease protein